MTSRLSKIHFKCHNCNNLKVFAYEELNQIFKNYLNADLTLKNFNQLLPKFICQKCKDNKVNDKNFSISDFNHELLFDTERSMLCDSCECMIPIPRYNASPLHTTCVYCLENDTVSKNNLNHTWPSLPNNISRDCPRCDGIKVVYMNRQFKSYFTGCSNYPKCHWSSDEFFNHLNEQ